MELFSEYFKKDHALLRIDARVKLLAAVAMLVMVLSYKGFVFPMVVMAFSLALFIKMKVPLRVFVLRLSETLFIAAILIVLKIFSGKEILFSLHLFGIELTGYSDGLMSGLMMAGRIVGAVSIVAAMEFSTPFTEFMAALSWLRIPKGFVEILMFAYRYVFVLLEDAMVIYSAQKNRLGYSNVRRGLSSFGTLAGSLTLKAFENSQSTTVAMLQRGYDGNMPMMRHRPFNTVEVLGSILFISIMGIIWKI